MATIWESIKDKLSVVLITSLIGLVSIFSDNIVSSIKEKVNVAEKRPAVQEKIAKEMASLVYDAEMILSYASQNLTRKNELHLVNDPFNISIEIVRKNELVNQALISRYWGKAALHSFAEFHRDVIAMEKAFHTFNGQYSLVEAGKIERADPDKIMALMPAAQNAFEKTKKSAVELAFALGK
jgi:hypothetical protein